VSEATKCPHHKVPSPEAGRREGVLECVAVQLECVAVQLECVAVQLECVAGSWSELQCSQSVLQCSWSAPPLALTCRGPYTLCGRKITNLHNEGGGQRRQEGGRRVRAGGYTMEACNRRGAPRESRRLHYGSV
jgi:hypothetical protein